MRFRGLKWKRKKIIKMWILEGNEKFQGPPKIGSRPQKRCWTTNLFYIYKKEPKKLAALIISSFFQMMANIAWPVDIIIILNNEIIEYLKKSCPNWILQTPSLQTNQNNQFYQFFSFIILIINNWLRYE